jgi:hypothetical protein
VPGKRRETGEHARKDNSVRTNFLLPVSLTASLNSTKPLQHCKISNKLGHTAGGRKSQVCLSKAWAALARFAWTLHISLVFHSL